MHFILIIATIVSTIGLILIIRYNENDGFNKQRAQDIWADADFQNGLYAAATIILLCPISLLSYLRYGYELLSYSDVALLASILLLFHGSFLPSVFIRVFKQKMNALSYDQSLIDRGEQRVALWSEVLLFAGSVIAVVTTFYVATISQVSSLESRPSERCLARLRDYIAPPLGPTSFQDSRPSLELQQKDIREVCKEMR